MIFVTAGTQGPFNRMIRAIDDWAVRNDRHDVFAQIGRHAWHPTRIQWVEHLGAREFHSCVGDADIVISHAGMGTILTALELGKPLLIMPRRAALLEQRNDHQVATARKLEELGLATVAKDEEELAELLLHLDQLKARRHERTTERNRLLETLRRFLETGSGGVARARRRSDHA